MSDDASQLVSNGDYAFVHSWHIITNGYDTVMDVRSDEYRRYFIAQTLRAQNALQEDVNDFFFNEDDTVLSRYNIPAMFA
mgnify:CR=1 FL=1